MFKYSSQVGAWFLPLISSTYFQPFVLFKLKRIVISNLPKFFDPWKFAALLYCTNGRTFQWDSCGVSKNWGGLWPWKHRCRGRRVIRKKNTGLRLEHLEKFIAVRILRFTVSNTNRIGSMGKIIHINHIDVWMHEWINDLGTVKSIHQIINQYTYLCTARGAKHLSEDGAGNSARKPWKIQKDSKPFAQSIMKPVLWWQEWNKHCVQTLHVPSCSKERRVSTSYPAPNSQLHATQAEVLKMSLLQTNVKTCAEAEKSGW